MWRKRDHADKHQAHSRDKLAMKDGGRLPECTRQRSSSRGVEGEDRSDRGDRGGEVEKEELVEFIKLFVENRIDNSPHRNTHDSTTTRYAQHSRKANYRRSANRARDSEKAEEAPGLERTSSTPKG